MDKSVSYGSFKPASTRASAAARGCSKKQGNAPEIRLRKALWKAGARYRKNPGGELGKPDLVFMGAKVAVFCDGDFWHGNKWPERKARLSQGHNAAYWVAKIERNMARDRETSARLEAEEWTVLRFWESEIRTAPQAVVGQILAALSERRVP